MNEVSPYAAPGPEVRTARPAWVTVLAMMGLLAGVVATFVLTAIASAMVYYGQVAECRETADAMTVVRGMASLLGVLAAATIPWALTWKLTSHRTIVTVAAVIALGPILYALGFGLIPGAWYDDWCSH